MGRAAIFMVIGFSTIFLFIGKNMASVGLQSVANAVDYYEQTQKLNIAVTGANLACTELFQNQNWRAGLSNVAFNGGTISATVTAVDSDHINIVTTGTYQGIVHNVVVKFQRSRFSKFAYFSDAEPNNIWWTSGDTVWGPYHSNTKLYIANNPVFYGKATSTNGIEYNSSYSHNPKFFGGYESGVSIPMPTDLSDVVYAAQYGGNLVTTTSTVEITFNSDSTVTYKVGSAAATTVSIGSFGGANGVFVVKGGNIKVQGTVNGRVTIAAVHNSSGQGGQVNIENDIKYEDNPQTDPRASDMLGLIAEDNIYVSDNAANNTGGVDIQASMFALRGGFGAEHYDTRAAAGSIRLLGGVIQKARLPVGTFSGSVINHGFSKSYRYDNRFMVDYPPSFPTTGKYEIISWLE